MRETVRTIIRAVIDPIHVSRDQKIGRSVLQPRLAEAFKAHGLRADLEDGRQMLQSGMRVWRSRDDSKTVETVGRRRIDIVVYDQADLIALVEIESDLDDLVTGGTKNRSGHYDVYSIARSGAGMWFDSYKSLERMAAAAFYRAASLSAGRYPGPDEGEDALRRIKSDVCAEHNPLAVPLFLVTGRCRPSDPAILKARLDSLGAELHSASFN